MALKSFLGILFTYNVLIIYAWAAVALHNHAVDNNLERETDGSYRSRDFEHYNDAGHNSEFDHEAILGSVKEAEEYDKLSPDEAKQRLALLLVKMDSNGDKFISRMELKEWILNSFKSLSVEEAGERMLEADENRDGVIGWTEYLQNAFGVDAEEEIEPDDTGDSGMLLQDEKLMWKTADINRDGVLDINEFNVFSNPEEHGEMHPFLINQTLREKDINQDGHIDFEEFIGDRGTQQDKSWLIAEKDKFDNELDINKDGVIDLVEIFTWIIPNNDEIAKEEVDHLFASADDDQNDLLSFEEVINRYDVFVGSEATDFGGDLLGEHFDDEL